MADDRLEPDPRGAEAPVLVTGGAGFMGHAVCRELRARGRRVALVDAREPPEHRPHEAPLSIADVRDAEAIDALVREASAVVHLAAVVGVDTYVRDPAKVIDVNVNGTRNVLEACRAHGRPVLLASSSEVYGANTERLREDSATVLGSSGHARWSYAVSKAAGEHLALAFARDGLPCVLTRYFNVYGPLLDRPGHGRVVSKFVGRMLEGKPLHLVDGGGAVRSLTYVDDAARGTVDLLLALERGERVTGRAFNVGRDEPVTMRELAEAMVRLAGYEGGIEDVAGSAHFGEGFAEIPHRIPDVSALREAVGFEAEVDLESGLSRVLAHWGLLRDDPPAPPLPPIPVVRPQLEPTLELMQDVQGILRSGQVTNVGPVCRRLEEETATWLGVDRVVAVSSGATALLLVARTLGARGKVLLPSFTYIATASGFVHAGFEPVFCDVDPETWTLDPADVERKLRDTGPGAAVVAVNVFGVPPDLERLARVAREAGAALVLDAAHGFGTDRGGRRVEEGPVATTFSLHATKTLPAVEGGLVTSPDPALLDEVARLRAHGLARDVWDSTPGYNGRLDEVRARVALHRLAALEETLERRRGYAERLRRAALQRGGGFFQVQAVPPDVGSGFQDLAVRCGLRPGDTVDAVAESFHRLGVGARRYFYPPLHRLRAWQGTASLPETEELTRRLLCLPLHDRMAEADLRRIEDALAAVAAQHGGP